MRKSQKRVKIRTRTRISVMSAKEVVQRNVVVNHAIVPSHVTDADALDQREMKRKSVLMTEMISEGNVQRRKFAVGHDQRITTSMNIN